MDSSYFYSLRAQRLSAARNPGSLLYFYNNLESLCNLVSFLQSGPEGTAKLSGVACSFWDCARGIIPTTGSQVRANYAVVIACSTNGFHASDLSYVQANYTIGANCGSAYYSAFHSFVNATFATARQNTTGYYANINATVTALATNANNNGNGVDYNPAPGAIPGTGNGNSDAIIVVS